MDLIRKLREIEKKALIEIKKAPDLNFLEKTWLKFLSRKGELALVMKRIKVVKKEEKPKIGKVANEVKNKATKAYDLSKESFSRRMLEKSLYEEKVDITAPGVKRIEGHLHPITKVQDEVVDIFKSMGFSVQEGTEVESDYYNFTALNIPVTHPARELMDTFWIKGRKKNEEGRELLLRTHTSSVQVRTMKKIKWPLRIIAPGKCFRHEATDASHETTFHQIEGLMISENVTLSNLKGVLDYFVKRFFGAGTKTRFRPGYFPFVEPGFELDITCSSCKGRGCSVCKKTGWVEIIPCGMVHPKVLKNAGLDPKKVTGFAFGMGLDRVTMMKCSINDIRLFYKGDLRFINQF